MGRLAAPWPLLLAVFVPGCTCGGKSRASVPDASSDANVLSQEAGSVSGPLRTGGTAAVFSSPIAALHGGPTNVVAGLVAADAVVRVTSFGARDENHWTTDALHGISWGADAELRLFPAADGVALVWRGPRDGGSVRTLALLGPHGDALGEPIEIGATFCATADELVWIETRPGGPASVRARRWSDPAILDVAAVPRDRDPSLVCGEHDVFVLGGGDDDLVATSYALGETPIARSSAIAIRDSDFGEDDEREREAYTFGDDLGLVRIGASGTISLRDVPRGGSPTSWRRLKHALDDDDDVVAVDGDIDTTLIVYTRDSGEACPDVGTTSEGVRAIRVDRKTRAEWRFELAPASCDRSPGPFWIAFAASVPVVAWAERATGLPTGAAPISGVAFRTITADGVRASRLEQAADAVVDASCDDQGCAMAALLRAPDSDGMRPAPIDVFSYP